MVAVFKAPFIHWLHLSFLSGNKNRAEISFLVLVSGALPPEQTPGLLEVADMTSIVNQRGYWASYNIPYFDSVYKRSGFQEMHLARKHDDSWSRAGTDCLYC